MLEITVPAIDLFDEDKEEFIQTKETVLKLEHSLVSISKWESKWCIPFLDKSIKKTREQTIDYIRQMTLTQNVDQLVFEYIYVYPNLIKEIEDYIDAPMTACWFSNENNPGGSGEIVTNELIYYWMITLNIPVEFQKWHLNRLLTLIRVCNIKNTPGKKMSKAEILRRNKELNAMRRAQWNTSG